MTTLDQKMDELALGRRHLWIMTLCFLVVLFDGYDGGALAFAAPGLMADLRFDPKTLGPVFSAHLVGMVFGSSLFGLAADRFGRRPAIIISTLIFGTFTIATGLATTFWPLMIFRLVTGLGLGGAVSNAVAVSSEFSPGRSRATVVSVVYSAFPLGSVLGGYLAVWLIKDFGWRSVFLVGGGVTLPLLVLVTTSFPESVRFLREAGAPRDKIARVFQKLGLPQDTEVGVDPNEHAAAERPSPVRSLFVAGRWKPTLLLWLTFFVNQLVVYFLFMWMPVILKTWGLSASTGIVASATQSLGGVFGAFCLARLIDRRGASPVLLVSYLAAFVLAGAIGSVASSGAMVLIAVVAACGFFLNGSNVNLAAVATDLYPTASRSTGVGWAMGIGKAGGIAGSLVGGVLLQTHIGLPILYPIAALPLLLASAAMWLLKLGAAKRAPLEPSIAVAP